MINYFSFVIFSVTLILSASANAQADLKPPIKDSPKITWGGFADAYYTFDFNAPVLGDRAFTTQAARANEFNINLVHLEAKVESPHLRGRIALQAGTSVQNNYSLEPLNGTVSGGELSRHIQEARLGHKISENTWLDAGIFFAHVGAETWLSKDNIVLTRSLVADYSPYYTAGVKLTHSWSERLTTQLIVSNGWQIVSENNTDKNMGTGVEYSFETWSVAYNTLIGREQSPDLNGLPRASGFRHFHDFIIKSKNSQNLEWVAQLDLGFQEATHNLQSEDWLGALVMARYSLSSARKISFRLEHYRDDGQVLIVTGTPNFFDAYGGSLGMDQALDSGILWRTELRCLRADKDIFPKKLATFTDTNLTATTSFSFSF